MDKKFLLSTILSGLIALSYSDSLSMQMLLLNSSQVKSTGDLWQRMRDGFQLDHRETKEVAYWEKRYGNQKYFNIIMQNAAPYLYFVVTEMERRGIPTELALIPIVESTYNPEAVSPAAISTGMWQFLADSGKRFGMTLNSNIDERKDIVKSTRGAIAYLQYLHDMFGSWELAIAAYNWGEGNINNAINSSGSKNFYALDVRDVTKQYIPKVIALANLIQNPAKFGLKLTNLNNLPYFAIVTPNNTLTLNNFITGSNITPDTFKKLNPQFNSLNYSITANQRLLLPVANQPIYVANYPAANAQALITPPIASNNTNIIATSDIPTNNESNDSINQLAAMGDDAINKPSQTTTNTNTQVADSNTPTPVILTTTAATASLAQESHPTTTQVQELLNPESNTNSILAPSNNDNNFTNYIVVTGDTLYSIAKKFSLSPEIIKTDNQLFDNTVKLNQKLLIRVNPAS